MLNNKGFTLIELILVIVLLGVLSATAAPKFIDLQADAKSATLANMKGNILSGAKITYTKLAIHDRVSTSYRPNGTDPDFPDCVGSCTFSFGYPSANTNALTTIIDGLSDIVGEADWVYLKGRSASQDSEGNAVVIAIVAPESNITGSGNTGSLIDSNVCYLEYISYIFRPIPPVVNVIPC
jgi:MSHA pilin protein MshA